MIAHDPYLDPASRQHFRNSGETDRITGIRMKNLVLLYGGTSGEHEVSKISVAGILAHIPKDLYHIQTIGIRKDGLWILQPESCESEVFIPGNPLPIKDGPLVYIAPGRGLVAVTSGSADLIPCDVVFPVLHGRGGEDGSIQGMLQLAGIPCVGASIAGSAIGMDKELTKSLCSSRGIPVLPWISVHRREAVNADGRLIEKISSTLGWPVFVKPACGGSSVASSRAETPEELYSALREALAYDERALVEPCIQAREIECAVTGSGESGGHALVAFAPGEVVPTHAFYDYEAKYIDPEGARIIIPANIGDETSRRIQALAIEACKVCSISDMARVDFFVDKQNGNIILNEINTIPGFTHISMYPMMCAHAGLSYRDLIVHLVDLAISRSAT